MLGIEKKKHPIDKYLGNNDWRIKENANHIYCVGHLMNYLSAKYIYDYWINHVFTKKIKEFHESGKIHIHDLSRLTPYSYFGKESIIVKYNDEELFTSFEELYDILDEKEELLKKEDEAYVKYPKSLLVLDLDNTWTEVNRVIKKKKQTKLHFLKSKNGMAKIVTENHPIITTKGEKDAKLIKEQEDIWNTLNPMFVDREITKLGKVTPKQFVENVPDFVDNGLLTLKKRQCSISPNMDINEYDMGYLIGILLAEGSIRKTSVTFSNTNKDIIEKAKKVLIDNNIGFEIRKKDDFYTLTIKNTLFRHLIKSLIKGNNFGNKALHPSFIKFSPSYLGGVLAGFIDGEGTSKNGHSVLVRIANRQLVNQMSYIGRILGHIVRECKPYFNKQSITGFKSNFTMYGFNIALVDSGFSLDTIRFSVGKKPDIEKYFNHKYDTGYGDSIIINNYEVEIRECDTVYDITTLTHTFLCNGILSHNCAGFSTSEITIKGLLGPKGRINSKPPKHLSSAINQLTNFVGVMSQEFAGAIALNDFSLYLAPFVYYDKLDYKQVKQEIQQFIFHMNQPNRWAGECPFTNITINLTIPEDLKDTSILLGGEPRMKKYGDFEKEMNMLNKAILEVLIEGDASGTPLTFPVLTIGVDKDFPWDSEMAKQIFQVTAKYGTPFFENFYPGTGRDQNDGRSMCCRLKIDTEELRKHTGGLFGNGDSMGSVAVATINLNRIGYEAKTEEDFFKQLEEAMDVSRDALELRRETINKMHGLGLYPYTKFYLENYKNFFSTIGVIGGNESMLNFLGRDMMDGVAIEFMHKVLDFMVKKCSEFKKETGNLYNLEAVPGEGAMYSLAKKDKLKYPDIIVSGTDAPFLSNATLPAVEEQDFLSVVRTQEDFQTKYTGGTTLNIYIGEKLDNYIQAKNIVKKLIENTKIPYFSITPTYSICKEHGYIDGEVYTCPTCHKRTEVFSRVVGYLKPLQQWNRGKREEFKGRKNFKIEEVNKLSKT